MQIQFKNAIVIPSYKETLALPRLLKELSNSLDSYDIVLVVDDSPKEISDHLKQACLDSLADSSCHFMFIQNEVKKGRGAAVRKGMQSVLTLYPSLEYVLECDADGSHTPSDIVSVLRYNNDCDLLVGSRYVEGSEIQGWPLSRRIFSWILNKIIPRVTQVPLNDITNGLRRYSTKAVSEILRSPQQNQGFIYLTEQAILVDRALLSVAETPITFIDRTIGQSTVTWREILKSLAGVSKIVLNTNIR